MAFPTDTGTVADNLSNVWTTARKTSGEVKRKAMVLWTKAGNTSLIGSSEILDFCTYLADAKAILSNAAAVPGIAAYAQQQINNPAYDVSAEFNLMMAQIDATALWIVNNFPKDANGYLLAKQWQAGPTGRTVDRQFTNADLVSFRTQLASLLATLN